MIASFDATMLILLFDREAGAPLDPTTGARVDKCQERITYLLQTTGKTKGARLIFPVPALAEFFVRVDQDKVGEYASQIQRIRGSVVSPFGLKAAIDFADMQRTLLSEKAVGRSAKGLIEARAKAKFDQQIVAISKSEGATVIYTDDKGLGRFAERFQIKPVGIGQLPLPPESRQGILPLDPPEPAGPERDEDVDGV